MISNPYLQLNDVPVFKESFGGQYLKDWLPEIAVLHDLASRACAEYDRRCDLSEVPERPNFRKRGHPSFYQIRKEEIDARYPHAVSLGFAGSAHDWAQYVYDKRPHKPRSASDR